MTSVKIDHDVLAIDCAAEVERIGGRLVELVTRKLRRRGLVIAISGGVDSSVCAALAARAVGPRRCFALLMPEADSSNWSVELGRTVAEQFEIPYETVDIQPTLEAIGCYRWRDEAIRAVFPEYGEGWKNKIAIAGGLDGGFNFFRLVVQSPAGEVKQARLPLKQYLQIVAATNFKQRVRKTLEYFHADRLNFAVVGTPNRLEYDQGFFVKNGDGAADVKPIAHLYKTQVYELARFFQLPDEICSGRPTTDTYSMRQEQDEFYYHLPYEKMDLALWAHNHRVPAGELAALLEIDEKQASYVYKDIEIKRETTRYLHAKALLVDGVPEIAVLD
jgi:NAD+ synthase